MKKTALLILCLLFSGIASAQSLATLNHFGGRTDVSSGTFADQFSVTCSETATTQTCIPVNGSIAATALLPSNTFTVTIASPVHVQDISINEPIKLHGFGNSLDWVYAAQASTAGLNGMSKVSSVTVGTPGSITLTPACSPACPVVGSTPGFFTAGRWYISTITRPAAVGGGTGPEFIDPEDNWDWLRSVDATCSVIGIAPSTQGSSCGDSRTISTLSTSGTTVTVTLSGTGQASIPQIPGQQVQISGTSNDAAFGGTQTILSVPAGNQITYNDASATGTGTGGTMLALGWTNKYGTATTWGNDTRCASNHGIGQELQFFGFDGAGVISDQFFDPYGTCFGQPVHLSAPTAVTPSFSSYMAVNYQACMTQPIHTLSTQGHRGLPPTNYTGHFMTVMDYFDPRWQGGIVCFWGPNPPGGIANTYMRGPQDVYWLYDDSDIPTTGIEGWEMPTSDRKTTSAGTARNPVAPESVVAIAAPCITYLQATLYSNSNTAASVTYPDCTVWSKQLSATAPSGCFALTAGTTPAGNAVGPTFAACSWADWLRNQYGTTTAMNTALGTSYNSFGTDTTLETDNITLVSGSATLAHTNVTPHSVAFFLTPSGGSRVQIAGDCPQWETGCAGTTGQGSIGQMGTFKATSFVAVGLVFLDANGDYEEFTTAGKTGSSFTPPANTNCSGTQTTTTGTAVATCIGPDITGTITYASGGLSGVVIGGAGSLPTGETLSATYTINGWETTHAAGMAVMDEDGTSSWIGTNLICPVTLPTWSAGMTMTAWETEIQDSTSGSWQIATQSGTAGGTRPALSNVSATTTDDGTGVWTSLGPPVCGTGGDWAAPSMTPAYGAALNAWTLNLGDQYLGTAHTAVETMWPDTIDSGPNFLGGYDTPAALGVIQAAQVNTDAMYYGGNPETPTTVGTATFDPLSVVKYKWMTHYYHKPIQTEAFFTQVGQSQLIASHCVANCFNTFSAEGAAYYALIQAELGVRSADGSAQWAGHSWWTNMDGQNSGFGFQDELGNPYDAVSNVTGTVTCAWAAVNCGGEGGATSWLGGSPPWVGQNMMLGSTNSVKAANQLWLATSAPVTQPFKAKRKGFIFSASSSTGGPANERTVSGNK